MYKMRKFTAGRFRKKRENAAKKKRGMGVGEEIEKSKPSTTTHLRERPFASEP